MELYGKRWNNGQAGEWFWLMISFAVLEHVMNVNVKIVHKFCFPHHTIVTIHQKHLVLTVLYTTKNNRMHHYAPLYTLYYAPVQSGWWFGTFYIFHILGISSQLTNIFQRV